ncbi:hypothetical protein DFJ77DRAFT_511670 [Powellomyces hirtus]|nr:hypothetical protein DFJ77DRAFT_511670 [Powellomyces hirtus]
MDILNTGLTIFAQSNGKEVVFPFVSSVSTAAALLGALLVISHGIVAIFGAASALGFLQRRLSAVAISAIATTVKGSPLHSLVSEPSIWNLWRAPGQTASAAMPRYGRQAAPARGVRSLAAWLTILYFIPFTLFLAGSILPLGLRDCIVETSVHANGNAVPVYPLADASLLGSGRTEVDYDNYTSVRICGAFNILPCIGMLDKYQIKESYRTRWLGRSNGYSDSSIVLGENFSEGRGVGDLAYREYKSAYLPVNNSEGRTVLKQYYQGAPLYRESRQSRIAPEYAGNLLIDWTDVGGISPVKIANPVAPNSAGRFTVRSLWVRPSVTCAPIGIRQRVSRSNMGRVFEYKTQFENDGAFENLPTSYPWEPTDIVPPTTWTAWKLAVVLGAAIRNDTITQLRKRNSTLLAGISRNATLKEITSKLPPNINVTSSSMLDVIPHPDVISKVDDYQLAPSFKDFNMFCTGAGGADIFNATRRLPDASCWFLSMPNRQIGPDDAVRDVHVCVAKTNITLEDTVLTVENGAVTTVEPLRIPIETSWALERPNVTIGDVQPFWRMGACDPSRSGDDDFESTACDTVRASVLQWPIGSSMIWRLVDGGSDALPSGMAPNAWSSIAEVERSSGGFIFDITGKSNLALRNAWKAAAANSGSAPYGRPYNGAINTINRAWTDNIANRVTGHKTQMMTADIAVLEKRVCYDLRFFIQIPVALALAIFVYVVVTANQARWQRELNQAVPSDQGEPQSRSSLFTSIASYFRGQARLAAQVDLGRALTNALAAPFTQASLARPSVWADLDGSRIGFILSASTRAAVLPPTPFLRQTSPQPSVQVWHAPEKDADQSAQQPQLFHRHNADHEMSEHVAVAMRHAVGDDNYVTDQSATKLHVQFRVATSDVDDGVASSDAIALGNLGKLDQKLYR